MILSTVLVSTLLALSAGTSSKPAAQQQMTWTNEAVEQLSGGVTFEPAADEPAASEPAAPVPASATAPASAYVREQETDWYREQAATVEAQLAAINTSEARLRTALADPLRYGTAAFPFGEAAAGRPRLTPENELALLQLERAAAQQRLNSLYDLARKSGLPPGVFR